jgi:hypothetical protein
MRKKIQKSKKRYIFLTITIGGVRTDGQSPSLNKNSYTYTSTSKGSEKGSGNRINIFLYLHVYPVCRWALDYF